MEEEEGRKKERLGSSGRRSNKSQLELDESMS
jgi:hypothetical protein